jgi:hypothetical protein
MIPFKNLAQETRDNLDIYKQLKSFLQPKPIKQFINTELAPEHQPTGYIDKTILANIKEFVTLKQVFDDNSEMVRIDKQRVKAVDCKVISILVEDALRQKAVAKIRDDNYIFIRRAVDVQTKAQLEQ